MAETPRWHERCGNTSFLQFGISSTKACCAPNPPWARTLGQSANGRPRPAHEHHFHRATPGGIADEAALEQFQKQGATYQQLVDADALSHKEVGTVLHDTLKAIHLPFALLDIAGGDAGQIKHALAGTEVNHYQGIDLSEPALELGAKHLKCVPFAVELDLGPKTLKCFPFAVELDHRDFVESLEGRPEPADAAWCGLSIHHLSTEGKLELLAAIHGSTTEM